MHYYLSNYLKGGQGSNDGDIAGEKYKSKLAIEESGIGNMEYAISSNRYKRKMSFSL